MELSIWCLRFWNSRPTRIIETYISLFQSLSVLLGECHGYSPSYRSSFSLWYFVASAFYFKCNLTWRIPHTTLPRLCHLSIYEDVLSPFLRSRNPWLTEEVRFFAILECGYHYIKLANQCWPQSSNSSPSTIQSSSDMNSKSRPMSNSQSCSFKKSLAVQSSKSSTEVDPLFRENSSSNNPSTKHCCSVSHLDQACQCFSANLTSNRDIKESYNYSITRFVADDTVPHFNNNTTTHTVQVQTASMKIYLEGFDAVLGQKWAIGCI